MNRFFKPYAVSILLALALGACVGHSTGQMATVISVTDGDTIKVRYKDEVERVRLIGVDAAELRGGSKASEAQGRGARKYLMKLAPAGSTVRLEFDTISPRRDKYGRLLCYVWLEDGSMANMALIKAGKAKPLLRFDFSKKQEFERLSHAQ